MLKLSLKSKASLLLKWQLVLKLRQNCPEAPGVFPSCLILENQLSLDTPRGGGQSSWLCPPTFSLRLVVVILFHIAPRWKLGLKRFGPNPATSGHVTQGEIFHLCGPSSFLICPMELVIPAHVCMKQHLAHKNTSNMSLLYVALTTHVVLPCFSSSATWEMTWDRGEPIAQPLNATSTPRRKSTPMRTKQLHLLWKTVKI